MKILIILCSNEFSRINIENIKTLKYQFDNLKDSIVDYCGISSQNDFENYEDVLSFKYKIVNSNRQLSKVCDFISDYKNELDYDWFIKTRTEVNLIDMIDFSVLDTNSINARARVYRGPKQIKYGMSVNGEGCWKNIGDCFYTRYETEIILDDIIYIFHKTLVDNGAFDKFYDEKNELQHEWFHNKIWKDRNVNFNVIGMNLMLTKYGPCHSGHLNYDSD